MEAKLEQQMERRPPARRRCSRCNNYWLETRIRHRVSPDLFMKLRLSLIVCTVCLGTMSDAAVPAPDQLLPTDTIAVVTIPDYTAARSVWGEQALARLWNDPALRPFREKLDGKWRSEVLTPLEERLELRLGDQTRLLQGQLTVAIIANGWPKTPGQYPGWLLAIDTRDQAPQLAEQLTAWKSKLTEAGRTVRSEKLNERDFTVVSVGGSGLSGLLGTQQDPDTAADRTAEIWFGQSDSVLFIGDQRELLEQVLSRQAGNGRSPLISNPDFATAHEGGIGLAHAYGWVHLKPLVDFVTNMAGDAEGGAMAMLQPSKVLPALGLQDLRSLSFAVHATPEGTAANMRIGIPESSRKGLFQMILPARKDAGPPVFVSADATRFQRLRVDLRSAWAALEGSVYSILPTARSVVELMFQSVGKDKDPNYDLRSELIGNLGDDVVFVEHRPANNSLAALNAAPSLILIGSKSPEKVAGAIKTLSALLPSPMSALREREVAGRPIYSMEVPQAPGGGQGTRTFSFGAGADYLAMSGDIALLESFLRGTGSSDHPLAKVEGLDEAAAKVGGMSNGWFGYENDRVMAQAVIEALRQDPGTIEQMLALTPVGEALSKSGGLKAWTDFTLLPPFEEIARYFHFSVYGLNLRAEDFNYRMFSPTPPGLRP
jgi:hypothetical protein